MQGKREEDTAQSNVLAFRSGHNMDTDDCQACTADWYASTDDVYHIQIIGESCVCMLLIAGIPVAVAASRMILWRLYWMVMRHTNRCLLFTGKIC